MNLDQILQQLVDWLVNPAGGGAFLGIAWASWQAEALKRWTDLTPRLKSGIMVVLSAIAVIWGVSLGEGDIAGLFADGEALIGGALKVVLVYATSQLAHALNFRR